MGAMLAAVSLSVRMEAAEVPCTRIEAFARGLLSRDMVNPRSEDRMFKRTNTVIGPRLVNCFLLVILWSCTA